MDDDRRKSSNGKEMVKLHTSLANKLQVYIPAIKRAGGMACFNPGKFMLYANFENYKDIVYNFKFRTDDVVVMTFPKSGTTWTQELIWTLRHNSNLDNTLASIRVNFRSPFLESDMFQDILTPSPIENLFDELCPGGDRKAGRMLQITESISEKRVIKTHLPFSFFDPSLLDTCKVVFVTRNPYDVIISYYFLARLVKFMDFTGTFDEFLDLFVNDEMLYGPYWGTIKDAFGRMEHPNLLCLKYEDMKLEPVKQIQKIDQFLSLGLCEAQIGQIAKYVSFSEMKASGVGEMEPEMINLRSFKTDGGILRKGTTGHWKEELTDDQKSKVKTWIQQNIIGMESSIREIISI